jgi:energy-coupling factor transporter ATP-binding protein EcfA2
VIREFHIRRYGCIQDATVTLTPIHALVGPNDSGKSTVLRAVATAINQFRSPNWIDWKVSPRTDSRFTARWAEPLFPESIGIGIRVTQAEGGSRLLCSIETAAGGLLDRHEAKVPYDRLGPAKLVRFDPDQLKRPSRLVDEDTAAEFPSDRGSELAGVYDTINNRNDGAFQRISHEVRRLFPTVANVRLETVN